MKPMLSAESLLARLEKSRKKASVDEVVCGTRSAASPSDLAAAEVCRATKLPLREFWNDVPNGFVRTIAWEFANRLDSPAPRKIDRAIRQVGALLNSEIEHWSRAELRCELERILRKCGIPSLSCAFAAHNARVNAECEQLISSDPEKKKAHTLSGWLRRLATANLLEVWPGGSTGAAFTAMQTAQASVTRNHDFFVPLARRLAARLLRGVPLGLFTDNHGEVVFDLEFLAWVWSRFRVPLVVFPKACPVETDCDRETVRSMLRRRHRNVPVTVVSGGSRVQGNPLDCLGAECYEALRRIRAAEGVVIGKGVANLETMAGLRITTLFLFAAKTQRVADRFDAPAGSQCALWVPAGRSVHDARSRFAYIALPDAVGRVGE